MEQFFSHFSITFELSALIAILATVIGTYFTNKRKSTDTYIQQRYEDVNYPNFIELEPYLYETINSENKSEIFQILSTIVSRIKDNRVCVNTNLYDKTYSLSKDLESNQLDKATYYSFCSCIAREYDISCKQLGIKRRSFWYKLNRKQFDPDIITELKNIFLEVAPLFKMLIFIYTILLIIQLIQKLI